MGGKFKNIMIKLQNLTKKFGKLIAVENLNLEIPDGEIFGLLGPNGAGKTTTLKMVAGILQPTAGQVIINNLDIQKEPEKVKAELGYIPDDPFIYEKLAGWEFLEFAADLYKIPRQEQEQKIKKIISVFDFQDLIGRRAEEYSRGNRQKLCILACLIHEPKIILVDEPVVGLDPLSIKIVKETFKKLAKEKGVTIFMSTHTLNIAEELCHRVGILKTGKLIDLGTISELKQKAHLQQASLEELYLQLTE